jgi:hypothetical protein
LWSARTAAVLALRERDRVLLLLLLLVHDAFEPVHPVHNLFFRLIFSS